MIDAEDFARELRDPARARALLAAITREAAALGRTVRLMHVCGTHEQVIARYGLRQALPKNLEIVMGPGCPVCVTTAAEIDLAIALAERGVTIATYGDILRVTGSRRSLADIAAEGASVRLVYDIDQAAALAARGHAEVVFFAIGFETTAVTTAACLLRSPPQGFSVLAAHRYIPPAMELIAELARDRIDGFIAAGHAATITGAGVFEPFVARHKKPVVVAGFEPLDILAALLVLIRNVRAGEARVDNLYPRAVTREGNRTAQALLWRVFERINGGWRGIAEVLGGSLALRREWASYDARERFAAELSSVTEEQPVPAEGCLCGQILSGLLRPRDCTLFGARCTPTTPVGACMVSSEGACRIWHENREPLT